MRRQETRISSGISVVIGDGIDSFKSTCRDIARREILDWGVSKDLELEVESAVRAILDMNDRMLCDKVFKSYNNVVENNDCSMVDIIAYFMGQKQLGDRPVLSKIVVGDYTCYICGQYNFMIPEYGMFTEVMFVYDKDGKELATIIGPDGLFHEMLNIVGSIRLKGLYVPPNNNLK